MLTEIKLANFKAFGDGPDEEARTAPMSKITLIYGPNSAGKSSLVQSLLLLKQSVEERRGPAQLAATGQYCDVGNYSSLVHLHDSENRVVCIGVSYRKGLEDWEARFHIAGDHRNRLRLDRFEYEQHRPIIRTAGVNSETILPNLEVDLTLNESDHEIARFLWTKGSSQRGFIGYLSDPNRRNRYGVLRRTDTIEFASTYLPNMVSRTQRTNLLPTVAEIHPSIQRRIVEIDNEVSILTQEIEAYAIRAPGMRQREATRISLFREKEALNNALMSRNTPFEIEEAASAALREVSRSVVDGLLGNISYLGPVRAGPQRVYRDSGITSGIGVSGEHTFSALVTNSDTVKQINEYFSRFGVGYALEISKNLTDTELGADAGGILLRDMHTKIAYSLVDVGFGISQIIPTVIEGVAGSSEIICVDEPEIHTHPRLQAKIADMIIETATSDDSSKQWIVETHSELLARRIQTRIAEGKLTPEDVSVLYIDPRGDHSEVIKLELDEGGEWLTDWPHGFFDDGASEIVARYEVER